MMKIKKVKKAIHYKSLTNENNKLSKKHNSIKKFRLQEKTFQSKPELYSIKNFRMK